MVSGTLTTAGGPANLREEVEPTEGGLKYAATFTSEKELTTNELSVAFLLPTASFGGKQIMIDDQPLTLPNEPAKKGEPRIVEKDAKQISLPMPAGTLVISGNFKFMIQDDREWGDPRYSMRVYFTPAAGPIKESKIELEMKLKRGT